MQYNKVMATDLELFGRKTFFIAPSEDLLPESYLSEFIVQGFETYIISANDENSLKSKVSIILQQFPNSILFFNIDKDFIDWTSYLKTLKAEHKDNFLLGILFNRTSDAKAEKIRSEYTKLTRVDAGFLSLQENNPDNFLAIQTVLCANKARGRRNSVRAECDEKSIVEFNHKGIHYKARLIDVNETNFSCHIEDITPEFPVFEQIHGVTLIMNGLTLHVSVALIMKRISNKEKKCIFMFIKDDGSPDLEDDKASALSKKICEIVINKNMKSLNLSI